MVADHRLCRAGYLHDRENYGRPGHDHVGALWLHAGNLPALLEGKTIHQMRQVIAEQTAALRNGYARDGKFTPVE